MKPNLICLALCAAAIAASFPAAAGSNSRSSRVALNPQPLPPKAKVFAPVINPPQERSIFIGGGRYDAVSLNPQPLPPKARGW
ncbi:MAG: hypothetical protein ACXWCV_18350 [Caldimonas sp.]